MSLDNKIYLFVKQTKLQMELQSRAVLLWLLNWKHFSLVRKPISGIITELLFYFIISKILLQATVNDLNGCIQPFRCQFETHELKERSVPNCLLGRQLVA